MDRRGFPRKPSSSWLPAVWHCAATCNFRVIRPVSLGRDHARYCARKRDGGRAAIVDHNFSHRQWAIKIDIAYKITAFRRSSRLSERALGDCGRYRAQGRANAPTRVLFGLFHATSMITVPSGIALKTIILWNAQHLADSRGTGLSAFRDRCRFPVAVVLISASYRIHVMQMALCCQYDTFWDHSLPVSQPSDR
jgi:hypothetical protein